MPIVRGRNIEVLFSAETIARRNLELAKEIAAREFHDLLVIAILKGFFHLRRRSYPLHAWRRPRAGGGVHSHLELWRGNEKRRRPESSGISMPL